MVGGPAPVAEGELYSIYRTKTQWITVIHKNGKNLGRQERTIKENPYYPLHAFLTYKMKPLDKPLLNRLYRELKGKDCPDLI
jgi:hypothetical protein